MEFEAYVAELDSRIRATCATPESIMSLGCDKVTVALWRCFERYVHAQKRGTSRVCISLYYAATEVACFIIIDNCDTPHLGAVAEVVVEFVDGHRPPPALE